MSSGFLAQNKQGQAIVSNTFKTLHFFGKATYYSGSVATSLSGGSSITTFKSTCPGFPVVFFSQPKDANGLPELCGVIRIYGNPSDWSIELLSPNTAVIIPEVYVFTEANAISSTDTHGLQVFGDDGLPTFDSRKRPLQIIGSSIVANSSAPNSVGGTGGAPQGCGGYPDFSTTTPELLNPISGEVVGISKPILSYSSVAQTCRQASNSQTNSEPWPSTAWTRYRSTYWMMYRMGVRIVGSDVASKWIVFMHGCRAEEEGSSGWFSGTNYAAGGTGPYVNETLNMDATLVMISDGAYYD